MAGSRIRTIVSRQWELIVALGARRRGMAIQQLGPANKQPDRRLVSGKNARALDTIAST